jgi:hypothetical protein
MRQKMHNVHQRYTEFQSVFGWKGLKTAALDKLNTKRPYNKHE